MFKPARCCKSVANTMGGTQWFKVEIGSSSASRSASTQYLGKIAYKNAYIPAVTACMRKMLVILNAMMRAQQPFRYPTLASEAELPALRPELNHIEWLISLLSFVATTAPERKPGVALAGCQREGSLGEKPSLSHQERKYREVFDGFPAVFGAFGRVISLRQGLSDKLLVLVLIFLWLIP